MSEPVNEGALNAAAQQPQPQQPPPFTGSPYGYNANPALLSSTINPDAMFKALKMSPVSDEELRTNKFLAGLGAPTRSGSIGESFSNALSGMTDLAMEQKKLAAQYAPMMMQHMASIQQNMIKNAEMQQKLNEYQTNALDSRIRGLAQTGTVTPARLWNEIQNTGTQLGVTDPAWLMNYYRGIAGNAGPTDDITDKVTQRHVANLPAKESMEAIHGKEELKDTGAGITPVVTGTPGVTQGLTPAVAEPAGMKLRTFGTQDTGQFVTDDVSPPVRMDDYPGLAALQDRVNSRKSAYQAALTGAQKTGLPPPPGAQPPAPAQGAQPPAPAQPPQQAALPAPMPPGARLPQGVPPPPAVQQAPAAPPPPGVTGQPPQPNPANVGGMPGAPLSERLKVLQQELAEAKTPEDQQALRREIASVSQQPVVPPKPTPIADGAVAIPTTTPPPGLTQTDLNAKAGTVPVGSKVQFNDIPPRPPLVNAAGGIDPVNLKMQEGATANFLKDTEGNNKTVSYMQDNLVRLQTIQDIAQKVRTGATGGVRQELASHAVDILNMTPGVSAETARSIGDAIMGGGPGALAAAQQFEKLSVGGAMISLNADMGQGGGRKGVQEFLAYLKAVPNVNMTPAAIAKLREGALRDYMRARTEQDARAQFQAKNGDVSQFDSWWSAKQQALGMVPQTVNPGGGLGSGIPNTTVQYDRDPNGRVWVTDGRKDAKGNVRHFYPNEQFITNLLK